MPDLKANLPSRPERVQTAAASSRGVFCALSILVFLSQFIGTVPGARAQGFGLTKKTVKLQRKMPAAAHLPGPGFDVQVNARDQGNADAARTLADLLTTQLQKIRQEATGQERLAGRRIIHCTISTSHDSPLRSPTLATKWCRRRERAWSSRCSTTK